MTHTPSTKTFEDLYLELSHKLAAGDTNSASVRLVQAGTHAIGKKIVEEAAEVWMAAEYQGKEALASRNFTIDLSPRNTHART